jgi:hypothetical protein
VGDLAVKKLKLGRHLAQTMATKTACFSDHGFPRHLERLESDSAVEGSQLSAFGLHIEMNSKNVRFSNDFNRKPVSSIKSTIVNLSLYIKLIH